MDILASCMVLVVLDCLLPHQIPEQHAEHCVRGQTKEDRAHAFIKTQQALSLAHLQHTIWKSMIQTPLKGRQRTVSTQSFCVFVQLASGLWSDNNLLCSYWLQEHVWGVAWTHPVRLVHRLVVETCTDYVKRCHGDGHGHSTDHGSYQSGEPGVWTEPLWGKTLVISWGFSL